MAASVAENGMPVVRAVVRAGLVKALVATGATTVRLKA